MSRTERRRLERKWRSGQGKQGKGATFYAGSPELEALDLGFTPQSKVVGVRCSFCQQDTPRATASYGMAKPRKIIGFDSSANNEAGTIWPVVGHVASQVIACPSCAGNIKPLIDKDGKIAVMNCHTVSLD